MDNIKETIKEIKSSELNAALNSLAEINGILSIYARNNDDIFLEENCSSYFKNIDILKNAVIRIGMCIFLLNEEEKK